MNGLDDNKSIGAMKMEAMLRRSKFRDYYDMNGERFIKDKAFLALNPVYDVSALDIQEYIKERLLEIKGT